MLQHFESLPVYGYLPSILLNWRHVKVKSNTYLYKALEFFSELSFVEA